MQVNSFKELIVWQEAHKLVLMIYEITKKFPKDEIFGLSSQIKRAAISITSNIAEGFIRSGKKEKMQFNLYSKGSLIEVENQIITAKDVGYISQDEFNKIDSQITRVHKLLNAYINGIK